MGSIVQCRKEKEMRFFAWIRGNVMARSVRFAASFGLLSIAALALSEIGGVTAVGAAVGGPEILIYRVAGARDDGGADHVGVATGIDCTNFSGVPQTVRFVARNFNSTLRSNMTMTIDHLATRTVVTHPPAGVGWDLHLVTGS